MGGVGQPAFLSEDAPAEIADVVATGRFRTADIRDWIAQVYRARYTVGGVYTLPVRWRCRPKVPRPISPKADLEQEEAWKKGDCATLSPRRA
jgi:hypothetical protein